MTYPPSGGERGPQRDSPDYPTTQFQAIRGDQPSYEDRDYRQPGHNEQQRYEEQRYGDQRYEQQRYGDQRYEQQRYEQPREYQRPYREEDAERQASPRRGLPWGWLALAAVVLIAAAGAGGYLVGHERGKKAATSGPKHFLSHTAVESYIAKQFSVANVQCYGGQDMPLTANSAFSCSAAGTSFIVLVKDPNTGSYQVLKSS